MKRTLLAVSMLCLLFSVSPACSEEAPAQVALTLTVGEQRFSLTLADTQAASELMQRLPLCMTLQELNGNEKFGALEEGLPVSASCPKEIHVGDLKLFGEDCLVLFYEGFATSYRYTDLASMEDAQGLADAVGKGDADIVLSLDSADVPKP